MSNLILENVMSKNNKVSFDFSKSYEENDVTNNISRHINNLPIEPNTSKWNVVQENGTEYLKRVFKINNANHLLYFLNEMIKYTYQKQHHPDIHINTDAVTVILYTHDIDKVTDLDLDMSKYLSELYEDVLFLRHI
jgi:pterin-4a-carbinolamine dehydratase